MLIDDVRAALRELEHNLELSRYPATTLPAVTNLRALVQGYDSLRPDWQSAPDWARWYAIQPWGAAVWTEAVPSPTSKGQWGWNFGKRWDWADSGIDIPSGIDWRDCWWRRPQEADDV